MNRDKIKSILEKTHTKLLFAMFVLSIAVVSGYYLSDASHNNEKQMIEEYFAREVMTELPTEYFPTFSNGDRFPVSSYFDKEWNQNSMDKLIDGKETFFFLVSPECEPCDQTIRLYETEIFSKIDTKVQIIFAFDTMYINQQIPKTYQSQKYAIVNVFVDSDYMVDVYNLHLKPSVFLIDKNKRVRYSQIGHKKYINPELERVLFE